ncbi:MAG: hypothetical protein HY924_04200 [Elusimicrobia bacterium]|nr:hypothetical protein [Elusimicrobiota bacterium]
MPQAREARFRYPCCMIALSLAVALVLAPLPAWSAQSWEDAVGEARASAQAGTRAALAAGAATHGEEAFALQAAGDSLSKESFTEILETVVGEGDGSSDLSGAATGYQFAVCHRIQFRDAPDAEFQDYQGKGTKCSLLVPALMAMDIYWAGNYQDGGTTMSRMESFYLFHFKVEGQTLTWHQILSDLSWVKGNPPLGKEMAVAGHEEHRLEAGDKEVSTRRIGDRELRVSIGFFSRPTP